MPMHIDYLIIGLGNTLRGDDGAGWVLAERLSTGLAQSGSAVQVRKVQQLLPELAAEISELAPDMLLIADCTTRQETVQLRRLDNACVTGGHPFRSHGLAPAELLLLAQRLYEFSGDAWLVTVPAYDFPHGEGLSAGTARAIDVDAPTLLAELLAGNPKEDVDG